MIIAIVLIIIIWGFNLMPIYLNVIATVLLGIKILWDLLMIIVKIAEIGEMRD